MSHIETWDRNSKGDLIPQSGLVKKTDTKTLMYLETAKKELDKTEDEDTRAIIKKAIEYFEKGLDKTKIEFNIEYTPLLDYEIKSLKHGKSCDGFKVQDIEADICSKHCHDPERSYAEWRDMKDPMDKILIADFIFKNSFPDRPKNEESEKGLKMLRELSLV